MTLKQVKAADRRYKQAAGKADKAAQDRANAIRAAVRAGISMADIARALDISRARVAQIVHRD